METLPDTPYGVLQQFSTSKESIIRFSDDIIEGVKEGRLDPLEVKAICKTMEIISEKINEATKSNQKTEAEKFGDKPFMNYGFEMHYTSVKTDYDYEVCNDAVYDRLAKQKIALDELIKQRQAWLKMMNGPEVLVDTDSGEQYTAYPPMKKTAMGVKLTIK